MSAPEPAVIHSGVGDCHEARDAFKLGPLHGIPTWYCAVMFLAGFVILGCVGLYILGGLLVLAARYLTRHLLMNPLKRLLEFSEHTCTALLACQKVSDLFHGRERLGNRNVSKNLFKLFREQGYRPDLVVDVGANHNQWNYWLRQEFPNIKVYAVEPSPRWRKHDREVHKWLESAVADHDDVRETVLSDEQGVSVIGARAGFVVKVTSLDTLLHWTAQTEGWRDKLLKIDCENHSFKALLGADRLFKLGAFRFVVVEVFNRTDSDYATNHFYDATAEVFRYMLAHFPHARIVDTFNMRGGVQHYDVCFWR